MHYKEVSHVIREAEISHGLLSAHWGNKGSQQSEFQTEVRQTDGSAQAARELGKYE